ncbi:cytochrome c(L), periplasmic [Thiohalorhabdus methylotrophus]|uniref:Cytochrome c(L), periplasmic n=1 Tax=Thiohalorhabdus methylotrophus TaxID=3242694 RepID=A0ABV4U037_9GAMM
MRQSKRTRLLSGVFLASVSLALLSSPVLAKEIFRNTVTGQPLDLSKAEVGKNPEAVKKFEQTGHNPLNGNEQAIEKGERNFLTACSGCHGHHAKGKIGPSLVDDYWTYTTNATDAGLFATIFGGARAQMGPHYSTLTRTEMLQTMAYIRSIYEGKASEAEWLTSKEREALREKRGNQ